jgi:GAF domain-containing protein
VTKSLIAVPILDFENQAVGVIQAINKMPRHETPEQRKEGIVGNRAVPFERNDEKILTHLTQHVGIAMRNAEVYREAISTSERATGLLNTIQSLSQDLGTQSMLLTITMHANKIVSSERATVFLVDEPNKQLWSVSTDTGQEIRIPKKAGIAGLCCTEGKVINIPDAYADSRFNQEVDKKTGFKTQSILAIPMLEDDAARAAIEKAVSKRKSLVNPEALMSKKSKEGGEEEQGDNVIGVIQMINKVSFDGQLEMFDESDLEVMELFAKFVGPKLAVSSMMAKRHSEPAERREADLALGKTLSAHEANKRASAAGLMVLGEMEEGEEDEGA